MKNQHQITENTAIIKNNYGKFASVWTNGRKNLFNSNSWVSKKTAIKHCEEREEILKLWNNYSN